MQEQLVHTVYHSPVASFSFSLSLSLSLIFRFLFSSTLYNTSRRREEESQEQKESCLVARAEEVRVESPYATGFLKMSELVTQKYLRVLQ